MFSAERSSAIASAAASTGRSLLLEHPPVAANNKPIIVVLLKSMDGQFIYRILSTLAIAETDSGGRAALAIDGTITTFRGG